MTLRPETATEWLSRFSAETSGAKLLQVLESVVAPSRAVVGAQPLASH
jgi:hypothetical protein